MAFRSKHVISFGLLLLLLSSVFIAPSFAFAQESTNHSVWHWVDGGKESTRGILNVYRIVLGLVDFIVVIGLLVASFANIFSFIPIKLDSYKVKQVLPGLIIGIILANLSFFIMHLFIEMAAIVVQMIGVIVADYLGHEIGTELGTAYLLRELWWHILASVFGNLPDDVSSVIAVGGLLGGGLTAGASLASTLAALGAVGVLPGVGAAGILLILLAMTPIILTVILGFLLYVRGYILIICVILSPIAFFSLGFPPLKSFWNKWWTNFWKWLIMAPLAFLVVAAGILFLHFVNNSATGNRNLVDYVFINGVGIAFLVMTIKIPFALGTFFGANVMKEYNNWSKKGTKTGYDGVVKAGAFGAGFVKAGGDFKNRRLGGREFVNSDFVQKKLLPYNPVRVADGIKAGIKQRGETADKADAKYAKSNPFFRGFASKEAYLREIQEQNSHIKDETDAMKLFDEVIMKEDDNGKAMGSKIPVDLWDKIGNMGPGKLAENVNLERWGLSLDEAAIFPLAYKQFKALSSRKTNNSGVMTPGGRAYESIVKEIDPATGELRAVGMDKETYDYWEKVKNEKAVKPEIKYPKPNETATDPTIRSFTITPATGSVMTTYTVEWEVENAESVTLNGEKVKIKDSKKARVADGGIQVYTLKATLKGNDVEEERAFRLTGGGGGPHAGPDPDTGGGSSGGGGGGGSTSGGSSGGGRWSHGGADSSGSTMSSQSFGAGAPPVTIPGQLDLQPLDIDAINAPMSTAEQSIYNETNRTNETTTNTTNMTESERRILEARELPFANSQAGIEGDARIGGNPAADATNAKPHIDLAEDLSGAVIQGGATIEGGANFESQQMADSIAKLAAMYGGPGEDAAQMAQRHYAGQGSNEVNKFAQESPRPFMAALKEGIDAAADAASEAGRGQGIEEAEMANALQLVRDRSDAGAMVSTEELQAIANGKSWDSVMPHLAAYGTHYQAFKKGIDKAIPEEMAITEKYALDLVPELEFDHTKFAESLESTRFFLDDSLRRLSDDIVDRDGLKAIKERLGRIYKGKALIPEDVDNVGMQMHLRKLAERTRDAVSLLQDKTMTDAFSQGVRGQDLKVALRNTVRVRAIEDKTVLDTANLVDRIKSKGETDPIKISTDQDIINTVSANVKTVVDLHPQMRANMSHVNPTQHDMVYQKAAQEFAKEFATHVQQSDSALKTVYPPASRQEMGANLDAAVRRNIQQAISSGGTQASVA